MRRGDDTGMSMSSNENIGTPPLPTHPFSLRPDTSQPPTSERRRGHYGHPSKGWVRYDTPNDNTDDVISQAAKPTILGPPQEISAYPLAVYLP